MVFSVLIIKTGALGDVLRTTFLLLGLKKKYEGCYISWLTSNRAKELLENNPLIDKIYTIEKEDIPSSFDFVLSLDDDKESAEVATKVNKNKMTGAYIKEGKVVYTKDSSDWFGMGLLRSEEYGGLEEANKIKKSNKKTYHEIMSKIAGIDYDKDKPILNLTKEEIKFGDDFAKKNGIKNSDLVIGINTGAGKRWQLKSWSIENTAKLASVLRKKFEAKVIILGGNDEAERNKEIIELANKEVIDGGTNNTLRQFSAIINICDMIVTSDTLAMFIALSLNKKVVVLMGPTSDAEIDLFGLGKKISSGLSCLCCYKRRCDIKPNCMDLIKVEEIYSAIKEQLKDG